MSTLYLHVWTGDETDWITLTPNDPKECDSSEFDEGKCTGFNIPCNQTGHFIHELRKLLKGYKVEIQFNYS